MHGRPLRYHVIVPLNTCFFFFGFFFFGGGGPFSIRFSPLSHRNVGGSSVIKSALGMFSHLGKLRLLHN